MRRIVAAMGVLWVCTAAPRSAEEHTLKLFDWLAGVWETSDSSRVVEEHWTTPTANLMIGMSRTVAENRTAEFEFLRIERRGDDLFYVPQPSGRPPVAFKLTSTNDGRFVFENTSGEDRVRRIEYRREGSDGLIARIEGARDNQPFALEYHYRRRQ
jgi:Domain of unknown function (DUF6265)